MECAELYKIINKLFELRSTGKDLKKTALGRKRIFFCYAQSDIAKNRHFGPLCPEKPGCDPYATRYP